MSTVFDSDNKEKDITIEDHAYDDYDTGFEDGYMYADGMAGIAKTVIDKWKNVERSDKLDEECFKDLWDTLKTIAESFDDPKMYGNYYDYDNESEVMTSDE